MLHNQLIGLALSTLAGHVFIAVRLDQMAQCQFVTWSYPYILVVILSSSCPTAVPVLISPILAQSDGKVEMDIFWRATTTRPCSCKVNKCFHHFAASIVGGCEKVWFRECMVYSNSLYVVLIVPN